LNQVCVFIRQFDGDEAPNIVNDSDLPEAFTVFDIPFIEVIGPATTTEVVAERLPLGEVEGIEITRDRFGCVYAGNTRLSAKVWAEIDGDFLLVRPLEAATPSLESGISRLWRRIWRKDCAHCQIFDHEEGIKWRHQKTHKFDDGSTCEMWNDVMAITAKDCDVAVISDDYIGYCRTREAIVDGRNRPCREFKR